MTVTQIDLNGASETIIIATVAYHICIIGIDQIDIPG